MNTNKLTHVALLAALVVGCTNAGDQTVGGRQNLGACPAGVHPGMACDASTEVACEAGDGLICYCDGESGAEDRHIVCVEDPSGAPTPPPPGGDAEACSLVHLDRCLAGERTECTHPDGRICGCYPTDGGAEIFCVEPAPAVPPCDDDVLRRCLSGESVECVYDDERICGCYTTEAGTIELYCHRSPAPPPTADTCTEEHYARCAAGEPVMCIASDGRACWCDGTDPAGGLECDPLPGTSDECTMDDYDRCAAGGEVSCHRDGVSCSCVLRADGTGELSCDASTPPPSGEETCTDEHVERCRAGEMVECEHGGLRCICDPTHPDGFVCG